MEAVVLGIGSRISHPEFDKGVVTQINPLTYTVMFIEKGEHRIKKDDPGIMVIERIDPDDDPVSLADVESLLIGILRRYSDIHELAPIAERWVGGKMVLVPGQQGLASKEIPLDQFWNKIVMLRDRIRVLEQRINSHEKLTKEDKINLQEYITRIYGSLTTFNVLFKLKEQQFVGEKGKE